MGYKTDIIDQTQEHAGQPLIVLAGATGNLGQRIAFHLLASGAKVKALVREGSNTSLKPLQQQGIILTVVDFSNPSQLAAAFAGASCIVSALNGLEDVMIGVQKQLLHAAIDAGVPRFIPSDYCIDYSKLSYGSNRNLDLRRKFNEYLDKSPIAATSILNGMFTELLTGPAPVILSGIKRIMYWGSADQLLDFTTMENTAEYTAKAALDSSTPRYLRIAGDVASARDLQKAAIAATGKHFRLLRCGGLGVFKLLIRITQTIAPQKNEVFPAWQGMQYLHNMFSGLPKLHPLDNQRYNGIHWTTVQEVLSQEIKKQ